MPDAMPPPESTLSDVIARVCGPLSAAELDLVAAMAAGRTAAMGGRAVRAVVLEALLLDPAATRAVRARAVTVRDAVIAGALSLREGRCLLPLELLGCEAADGIAAYGVTIPRLTIAGGRVGRIEAGRAEVRGELAITHQARVTGGIDLRGATLGALIAGDARIEAPPAVPKRPPVRIAIDAGNLRAGVVLLTASTVVGEIRLGGAEIGGTFAAAGSTLEAERAAALTLDGAKIGGRADLTAVRSDGGISVQGAEIGLDLDCSGAKLVARQGAALVLSRSVIRGSVLLKDGFAAKGAVTARGARIGGDFDCDGHARFEAAKDALLLSGSEIGGDFKGNHSLVVDRTLRMAGTSVKGQIELFGATLRGPEAWAARGLLAARSVRCKNMTAEGLVALNGARIGGELGFSDATLRGLDLTGAQVVATLDLKVKAWAGALTLDRARAGVLIDARATWPEPGGLSLAGFTFDALGGDAPRDAGERLEWLARQAAPEVAEGEVAFDGQPYEQLIAAYRRVGQEDDAQRVAIVKQRMLRRAGGLGVFARVWSWFLEWSVGYGYRQLRPLMALVLLLVVGTAVFARAHGRGAICPVKRGEVIEGCVAPPAHPVFVPLVYSFELLIPNPDLGQREAWRLTGGPGTWGYWLYRWAHTLLGWALAILLALSPTRLLRKD